MTIRELVNNILSEIGYLTDGESASESDAARVRLLINKAVKEYNLQDFLHFTKTRESLGTGKVFTLDPAPLKVDSVFYISGDSKYILNAVDIVNLPAYEHTLNVPSVYCFDKQFDDDGKMTGRIQLDCSSTYEIIVVYTSDIKPFTKSSEVFSLPPEYENLITADVQYRLLANSDASDTLLTRKASELTEIKRYIKRNNFTNIDNVPTGYTKRAAIDGFGRLP